MGYEIPLQGEAVPDTPSIGGYAIPLQISTAPTTPTPTSRRPRTLHIPVRGNGHSDYHYLQEEGPTHRNELSRKGGNFADFQVNAPRLPKRGAEKLNLQVATEDWLEGFIGKIRLLCGSENVDLSRVRSGVVSFAADHDTLSLVGRVYRAEIVNRVLTAQAEIAQTPNAQRIKQEIDGGMRSGISPGFIVQRFREIDKEHPDYDRSELLQLEITKWQVIEISTTAIPRNQNARILGRASMNGHDTLTGAMVPDDIVNTDDLLGLSLAVTRKAVNQGVIQDVEKRSKLVKFYQQYDRLIAQGVDRDTAAYTARSNAGL